MHVVLSTIDDCQPTHQATSPCGRRPDSRPLLVGAPIKSSRSALAASLSPVSRSRRAPVGKLDHPETIAYVIENLRRVEDELALDPRVKWRICALWLPGRQERRAGSRAPLRSASARTCRAPRRGPVRTLPLDGHAQSEGLTCHEGQAGCEVAERVGRELQLPALASSTRPQPVGPALVSAGA